MSRLFLLVAYPLAGVPAAIIWGAAGFPSIDHPYRVHGGRIARVGGDAGLPKNGDIVQDVVGFAPVRRSGVMRIDDVEKVVKLAKSQKIEPVGAIPEIVFEAFPKKRS